MNLSTLSNKFALALVVLCLSSAAAIAQGVFYSEDFAGGFPNDWTTVEVEGNGQPTSVWFYTTEGPTGAFATDPLASTTAANGWMIFDSDLNCNIGAVQDAWLISPAIDCSQKENVWLLFETYYRSFSCRPQIRIGTDINNLSAWETIEVFPGITANQFGGAIAGDQSINPQAMDFDISEYAAGVANVRIAFQFLSSNETLNGGSPIGCAYNWQLDDVELTDLDPRPANDMRVNAFFAIAPNAVTPYTQVEPIGFIADIQNIGSATQDNPVLTMTVRNSADEIVYQEELAYGAIASDSLAENVFFPLEFDVPAVPDTYTATYSLAISNPDSDPTNNEREFTFIVSDSLFSKDLGATRSVAPAADESFTYGNVYFVPAGANLFARYLTFGVVNADELVGKSVTTFLYSWNGVNDGRFIEPGDYSILAVNSYFFTGDEGTDLITLPVDLDGNEIALEDNTYYMVAIQYETDDDQSCFLQAGDNLDYAAMNFYTDSLEKPRYGAVLDVSNTGTLDLLGFGFDIFPVARLSISAVPVGVADPILPEGAVTLFPNPVSDQATLEFNLDTPSQEVEVKVFDMTGRMLQQQYFDSIKSERIQLNTKDLINGNYMIRVRTDAGIRTLKMTVNH